ncbi:MAG: hypothetical protein QW346_00365 [Candidatus Micrarchaeaceae archaeon]
MAKELLTVDVDGVLADTVGKINSIREKDIKRIIRKEEITDYDLTKTDPYRGLEWESIEAYFKKAWANYNDLQLEDPEIPEIISKLHDHYIILLVTASVAEDEQIKNWLKKNNIPYDELVHLNRQVKKLKNIATIHIEDYYELAIQMPANMTVLLLKQPWNEKFFVNGYNSHANVVLMNNWHEIYDYLTKRALSKEKNIVKA